MEYTVQELINALNKIENKSQVVRINIPKPDGRENMVFRTSNMEIQDLSHTGGINYASGDFPSVVIFPLLEEGD